MMVSVNNDSSGNGAGRPPGIAKIETRAVSFYYGRNRALTDVSLVARRCRSPP
jgi:hypothetical protein